MEDIESQLEEVFWNAEESGLHYRLHHPETEKECGIIEVREEYVIYLERYSDDDSFQTNIEDKTLEEFREWVVERLFS